MSGAAGTPGASADKLRKPPARDWVIRFAFGAAVSALAAIVAKVWGPAAGGLFLAFPAILLASLTLVAKEEGAHRAREDARGAALGALGLVAFGLVVWAGTPRWPVVVTLLAATLAWAVVSGVAYLVVAARHRDAGNQ
ncbi:putative membrane protein (GlpM family) [Actinoplanes octamycinicus]|uniref:Putative membrane protein (GlpM family) n=1 Tax=Actinoplanes octamycinicus TaxID=135948 RepID=A0A7W7H1R5_9ACTN|nr:DUF3147 family protein [Actinoplanes octamycinicus]MBB4742287.1 putative membrane protein (GlpM family) [Actinoplanes octamycinicus]GIE59868.1 hypothetical protein Aoc01nite_52700 [Actinoplanes octamycinicus]